MQLIGMLDSPYVRRVAIAMRLLGLDFEHRKLSVFRDWDTFRGINPVVKVPTLVCDDGTVLVESELILRHAEILAGRHLWPSSGDTWRAALRAAGLGLVVMEKAVALHYEHELRPPERRHPPWMARVSDQLGAALGELEAGVGEWRGGGPDHDPGMAAINVAVAWRFTQLKMPDQVASENWPALAAFSAAAERHPAFVEFSPD